jgi:fatty acid desaturase
MSAIVSPATPDFRPGGYAELATEVRRLGLLKPRPGFYAVLLATDLVALGALTTGMVLLRGSWWTVLLAPLFAVVSTQIAFFGHDAGHRQITRKSRPSRLLGLFAGNLLNGLSFGWWLDKHNAHHAHPNDLESDPDVHAGALVFDASQATGRRGIAGWATRHQAWLFFPMLTLEAMNLHLSSVISLCRPGRRNRMSESLLMAVHFAAYVGLVVTTMTWQQTVVFVVVHQALFGVYLGCSFAPGHKGMPVLPPEQASDPLLRQVLTSRNIRGGAFADWALGGLNYQIEHHLFPSMPRPCLARAHVVVRGFCEARGVEYEVTSARSSYARVLEHLSEVGAGLRAERRAP